MCEKSSETNFQVGDIVECVVPDIPNRFLTKGSRYTVLTVGGEILDIVDDRGEHRVWFSSHFKLISRKQEDIKMDTKVETKVEQKTKRIPFSVEAWKDNRGAKVFWKPTSTEILYFDCWRVGGASFIGVYKAPNCEYAASTFTTGDYHKMELEIPVTTKRIPFDPERKDAKVFIKADNSAIKEWYVFSNGLVAGMCGVSNYLTAFNQDSLEMEVEE